MAEREYTIEEASKATGVSVSTLRRLVKSGALPHRRVNARRVAILEHDLPRPVKRVDDATVDELRRLVADLTRRLERLERNATRSALYGQTDSAIALHVPTLTERSEPPESHYTATYAGDQVVSMVPAGMMSLAQFASNHGVPKPTAKDHANDGAIRVTVIPNKSIPGESIRFVAPDERAGVLAYWRDHWTGKGGRSIRQCGDLACPCHELLPLA